jgi:hypothetical protein
MGKSGKKTEDRPVEPGPTDYRYLLLQKDLGESHAGENRGLNPDRSEAGTYMQGLRLYVWTGIGTWRTDPDPIGE